MYKENTFEPYFHKNLGIFLRYSKLFLFQIIYYFIEKFMKQNAYNLKSIRLYYYSLSRFIYSITIFYLTNRMHLLLVLLVQAYYSITSTHNIVYTPLNILYYKGNYCTGVRLRMRNQSKINMYRNSSKTTYMYMKIYCQLVIKQGFKLYGHIKVI